MGVSTVGAATQFFDRALGAGRVQHGELQLLMLVCIFLANKMLERQGSRSRMQLVRRARAAASVSVARVAAARAAACVVLAA